MRPPKEAAVQVSLLIIAIGIALSLFLIIGKPTEEFHQTSIVPSPNQVIVSAGLPVRLKIAKIGVDAVVEPMGLTAEGDMEAPSGAKTVGWYKLGVYPGNKGSAVIDGHYGTWQNGETSVFDDLNKLVPGDSIVVEDDKRTMVTFIVQEIKTLGEGDDATVVFRSSDGKAHLNLITCQGDWTDNGTTRKDRLVVFADMQVR